MFDRNKEIRKAKQNVPYWLIAERLAVHENTLKNWMRKELPDKQKTRILRIIEELKFEIEKERDQIGREDDIHSS
ncbi:hypothetical protein ATL39_1958 [Sinobaca qinghaiensis]|uniref:Uncharacterized protein n=1 Tax=Sinobaca qinghaiensis TaxID=342944 RepID=A0A419V5K7_9BACL|nr:hypothetical protein [Sinobaca qinghaiensis]RKD73656.1 hypothetical protein ATL39_1958 [Sinobaca qinghaiensis]